VYITIADDKLMESALSQFLLGRALSSLQWVAESTCCHASTALTTNRRLIGVDQCIAPTDQQTSARYLGRDHIRIVLFWLSGTTCFSSTYTSNSAKDHTTEWSGCALTAQSLQGESASIRISRGLQSACFDFINTRDAPQSLYMQPHGCACYLTDALLRGGALGMYSTTWQNWGRIDRTSRIP
jgi:hypothetical protein